MGMNVTSDAYARYADGYIALLHTKCTRGLFSPRLFKAVANGVEKYYPLEKIEWMKEFLNDTNQQIAAGCLECLVSHGMKLGDITDLIEARKDDRIFSHMVIDLATKLNDPDTLLIFVDEDSAYLNKVILALKGTGNESYLTSLMLSDNQNLAMAVNRIIGK